MIHKFHNINTTTYASRNPDYPAIPTPISEKWNLKPQCRYKQKNMTDSLSITRSYPITNMNDNINMDNAIEVSVTDRILPTTTQECLGHQNSSYSGVKTLTNCVMALSILQWLMLDIMQNKTQVNNVVSNTLYSPTQYILLTCRTICGIL